MSIYTRLVQGALAQEDASQIQRILMRLGASLQTEIDYSDAESVAKIVQDAEDKLNYVRKILKGFV